MDALSRRSMLALLTAAVAVSAGRVYLWVIGPDALIGKILNRRLPGVRIDAASIAALSRDVQAGRLGRKLALEVGTLAASDIGIDALAQFKLTAKKVSQLERKVLTLFILNSNFLDVRDPKSDLVTYYEASRICPNRFAQYDG